MNKIDARNKVNLNLSSLIINRIINAISFGHKKVKLAFPLKVTNFSFIKKINIAYKGTSFTFAIYKDKFGKQAFAKQWTGDKIDFQYYSLINEINFYINITKLPKNKMKSLRKKYPDIHIPKFIAAIEEKNRLLLLTDKIEGKTIEKLPLKEKIFIYEHLIYFFHDFSEYLSMDKNSPLVKRTSFDILVILILSSLRAIIRKPQHTVDIIKGNLTFIRSLPTLISQKGDTFVHRSLEDHNIIFNKNNITVLDFQLAAIGNPFLEVVSFLIFSWTNKRLCRAFYETKLMQKYVKNKNNFDLIKGMACYIAIDQMADGDSVNYQTNFSFLRHFITLNWNKTK